MKQQIIERFPGISCAWMDAGRKAEAECYSVDYMDVVFRYKYGGVGLLIIADEVQMKEIANAIPGKGYKDQAKIAMKTKTKKWEPI